MAGPAAIVPLAAPFQGLTPPRFKNVPLYDGRSRLGAGYRATVAADTVSSQPRRSVTCLDCIIHDSVCRGP
jgi:hypothetical protein